MAITVKTLIPSKQMEAAQTIQYTAPAQGKAIIDKFTATNTTGSPAIITVNLYSPLTTVGANATGKRSRDHLTMIKSLENERAEFKLSSEHNGE